MHQLLANNEIECDKKYSHTTYKSCECPQRTKRYLLSAIESWHHKLREEDHLISCTTWDSLVVGTNKFGSVSFIQHHMHEVREGV